MDLSRFRCAIMVAIIAARYLLVQPAFAEETAVKIGVMGDESGPYSDVGGMGAVEAVKMAVEDFGGSVLGKPIDVISGDHQNKADIGASMAKEWFDRQGVDVITDLTNSAVALAVQGIAKDRKKIDLVTSTHSTELTNKACSPYGVHWTFDAYAVSAGTARAIMREGGKSWFFIAADYTFGQNLEQTATRVITGEGGTVVGHVRHPLGTADFSSYLLQAQASGADVIGLANTGNDLSNAVKEANEFKVSAKQKLALLAAFITDIDAIGLKNAGGSILTEAFYWDLNDKTRAWSQRFFERRGKMPTMVQAGTYSAIAHYLSAVKSAGTKDADKVMEAMRKTPVNDAFWSNGHIREDGVMVHDMLLLQVKTPEESKKRWDYYKLISVIPSDKAFQPLSESSCPLVVKAK